MKPSPSPALVRQSTPALVSVVAALALTACSTSGPTGLAGVAPPDGGPPAVVPLPRPDNPAADTEWTTHGLNLAETRFSPVDQAGHEDFRPARVPHE